ncbi:MAG: hypothetical protein OMM_06066 [Candidatus Magnetoglobus multicellularis str. Araruama]|uniref:IPTL-CTERM protein sorting domain-containing protein n=1 Tax=Candidatus Magnetoglobus multicellularis str. Araruama TaxID=890399 RepID=A0A1V1NS98_9BACT|nr:MAG: hypothetical protein OMM_06066 [Candidatus Magnetoglobus multicellularis str. Araruama]
MIFDTRFDLIVTAINDAPIIGTIENQYTEENTDIHSFSFKITDIETTDCSNMAVSYTLSNETLVEDISYICSAVECFLSIIPVTHESGSSTITITVTDQTGEGLVNVTQSFELIVKKVITVPTLNEWGIIVFMGILMIFSIRAMKKFSLKIYQI